MSQAKIIKLIIKYLKPYDLIPFFKMLDLPFDAIFKYDATPKYKLDDFEPDYCIIIINSENIVNATNFNLIFDHFPNIIITGITIAFDEKYSELSIKDIFRETKLLNKCDQIKRIANCGSRIENFDISYLNKCINLEYLLLPGHCSDIMVLESCPKLKYLDTHGQYIVSVLQMPLLPNLRVLKTIHFRGFIVFLNKCVKLRHLTIAHNGDQIPMNFIGVHLQYLRSLELHKECIKNVFIINNDLQHLMIGSDNFHIIEKYTKLTSLEIYNHNIESCADIFKNLPQLKNLELNWCAGMTKNIFKSLKNIETLRIRVGRGITNDDLYSLGELTNLCSITLYGGEKDFDISCFNTCNKLKYIELFQCNKINFKMLTCTSLKMIVVRCCDDLKYININKLKQLYYMKIEQCPNLIKIFKSKCSNLRYVILE